MIRLAIRPKSLKMRVSDEIVRLAQQRTMATTPHLQGWRVYLMIPAARAATITMEVSMTLSVIPFYAAALAVIYVVLAGLVVRQRVQCKVGLGDGQQPALVKAVRIHGNFAEYVPLLLILLLILEIQGAALWQLHLIGGLTLLGRISHAVGLSQTSGTSVPRMVGMLCTFIALLSAAAFLVLSQV